MNTYLNFVIILFFALLLPSCGDDNPDSKGNSDQFNSGAFILNQGQFGNGTGSIDHLDDQDTLRENIFQSANDGLPLGNIVQSMIIQDDIAYVSINNAAKIVLASSKDFSFVDEFIGIDLPRSFSKLNDNYIVASSWGSNGFDGALHVINTATNEIERQVDVGGAPEHMLTTGDLYVCKSNGFMRDSLLEIRDPSTLELESTLVVGDGPIAIEKTSNNSTIYVLSSGYSDFLDPTLSTGGQLSKIVDKKIVESIPVANGANGMVLLDNLDVILYIDGTGLHKVNMSDLTDEVVFPGFFYALGYYPLEDEIWLADAKDFASKGEIIRLSTDFTISSKMDAGIIPGAFYFN